MVSWKLRSDKEDVDLLAEVSLLYVTQEWWTSCRYTSEGALVAQQAVPQFYYTHLSAFQFFLFKITTMAYAISQQMSDKYQIFVIFDLI